MEQERKYLLTLTTAGELASLIKQELEKGNPLNTPELWNEFILKLANSEKVKVLGTTNMDAELLAANLRESGTRARVLKPEKYKKSNEDV